MRWRARRVIVKARVVKLAGPGSKAAQAHLDICCAKARVWIAAPKILQRKERALTSSICGATANLQTDPTGYADGMNMYGYVGGDPVNRGDPSGLTDTILVVGQRRNYCGPGSVCFDNIMSQLSQLTLSRHYFGGGGGGGNGAQAVPEFTYFRGLGNAPEGTECEYLASVAESVRPDGAPPIDAILSDVRDQMRQDLRRSTQLRNDDGFGYAIGSSYGRMYSDFRNGGALDFESGRGTSGYTQQGYDYGNFAYGAVGRQRGIPGYELDVLAGLYQDNHPVAGSIFPPVYPYGDDPRNAAVSNAGQEYVNRGCAK